MEQPTPRQPPMPPVVYVPTTDETDPATRRVVMHQVADGRTALYTYSAPDRLAEFYRPDSPWVLLDVAALQRRSLLGQGHGRGLVQLTGDGSPGRGTTILCALVGLASLVAWGTLTLRADSALGRVGAGIFLATGLAVLMTAWGLILLARGLRTGPSPRTEQRDGDAATRFERDPGPRWWIGMAIPALMGIWALVMATTGLLVGQWVWAALLLVPIVFFLTIPALALIGRIRPGGVWVTQTRVIDEQHGLITELDFADAFDVRRSVGRVKITGESSAVRARPLAPAGMRRAPGVDGVLTIDTSGLAEDELVALLRSRLSGSGRT